MRCEGCESEPEGARKADGRRNPCRGAEGEERTRETGGRGHGAEREEHAHRQGHRALGGRHGHGPNACSVVEKSTRFEVVM